MSVVSWPPTLLPTQTLNMLVLQRGLGDHGFPPNFLFSEASPQPAGTPNCPRSRCSLPNPKILQEGLVDEPPFTSRRQQLASSEDSRNCKHTWSLSSYSTLFKADSLRHNVSFSRICILGSVRIVMSMVRKCFHSGHSTSCPYDALRKSKG